MNLATQFLQTAHRYPDRTAVFYGETSVTYADLLQQTLRLSNHLRQQLGVQPGDRVGLWMRNRPEFIPAFLGALHAGAIVVPINHFLKPDEIAHQIDNAGIRTLIAEEAAADSLAPVQATRPGLQVLSVDNTTALTQPPQPIPAEPSRGGQDVAVLIYTSGTTGRPKGAMLSHANLLHNVESCRKILEVVDLDRFVLMLPMFHSFMITVCILLPLFTGGAIVLIKSLQPARAMLGELLTHRGSVLPAMAQVFRALAALPPGMELPLRLCISGAGPLPANILKAFNARFPAIPLIEGYGLSEASPVVAVNPLHGPWIPGTIGLPIPDVEVSVRDEDGHPLPDLVDGEICVRGGNVMLGYWEAPESTTEALRDGWLLTGDIGHRRSDGYFVITDRKKDMLKPNGLNVYPREIEEVICQFPTIREAAVIGEPDERRGERPVAFVTTEDSAAYDEKALLAFLKERLADYKLPRRAIHLAALPHNSTGKILKTRLREMLAEFPPTA